MSSSMSMAASSLGCRGRRRGEEAEAHGLEEALRDARWNEEVDGMLCTAAALSMLSSSSVSERESSRFTS